MNVSNEILMFHLISPERFHMIAYPKTNYLLLLLLSCPCDVRMGACNQFNRSFSPPNKDFTTNISLMTSEVVIT